MRRRFAVASLAALMTAAACTSDSDGEDTSSQTESTSTTTPSTSESTTTSSTAASSSTTATPTTAEPTSTAGSTGTTGGEPAVACGTVLSPFEGGTRLRPRVYAIDEGPDAFVGWQDSELSQPCAFARASDGEQRCLPGSPTALFSDAACTQPAVVVECDPSPGYVQVVAEGACDPSVEVYSLGAPTTGTLYQAFGGCTESGTFDYVPVDALIDPSEFVAADDGPAPEGDSLRPAIRVADDGACIQIGAWSTETDSRAYQGFLVGADDYWFPRLAEPVGPQGPAWDSATCDGNPVAYGCQDAELIRVFSPPALYDLGTPLDASTIFRGDADSCTPFQADDSVGHWALGATREPTEFEEVSISRAGDERIKASALSDEGGELLQFLEQNYDSTRDEVCRWFADVTGQQRCYPLPLGGAPTFVDDACTQPVFVDTNGIVVDFPIIQPIEREPFGCLENNYYEAYEVDGAPTTVTSWYVLNAGECGEFMTGSPAEAYPLTRIDDTEFATATLQTR